MASNPGMLHPGDPVAFPSRPGGRLHWVFGVVVEHRLNDERRVVIRIEPGQGRMNPKRLRVRNRTQVSLRHG